jgi:hypothetical protein
MITTDSLNRPEFLFTNHKTLNLKQAKFHLCIYYIINNLSVYPLIIIFLYIYFQ